MGTWIVFRANLVIDEAALDYIEDPSLISTLAN